MKNIGNRMAMKLAKEKFGDNAGILRHRRCFMIVKIWHLSRRLSVTSLKGIGLSWESALQNAGIHTPGQMAKELASLRFPYPRITMPEQMIKGLSPFAGVGINPDMAIIDDLESREPRIATPEETDKLIEDSQE